MFRLIEICCTYVTYQKMLILGKIGLDSSRDTSEIAWNQKVNNNCIESNTTHELLEITIDSKLIFETNITKLCKRPTKN